MNDAQFAATQGYLEQLQRLILLSDYEIHLKREPAHEGCWASVVVGDERHAAWVRVAWPEFYDELTPEDQRLYLMHELVHVIADGPDRVLRAFADRRPDDEAAKYAKEHHHTEVEFMTHKLARILAPLAPLPRLPHTHSVFVDGG